VSNFLKVESGDVSWEINSSQSGPPTRSQANYQFLRSVAPGSGISIQVITKSRARVPAWSFERLSDIVESHTHIELSSLIANQPAIAWIGPK
jgi:hypothetical protein